MVDLLACMRAVLLVTDAKLCGEWSNANSENDQKRSSESSTLDLTRGFTTDSLLPAKLFFPPSFNPSIKIK